MSCCECCGLWIVLGLRVAGDCVELWNVSKSRLDRTWRQNANLLSKMQVLLTTTHRCIATIPASIDLSIHFISFASLFAPFFYFVYKSTKQKTFKQSCSAIFDIFPIETWQLQAMSGGAIEKAIYNWNCTTKGAIYPKHWGENENSRAIESWNKFKFTNR